jgi:hypothetical protein
MTGALPVEPPSAATPRAAGGLDWDSNPSLWLSRPAQCRSAIEALPPCAAVRVPARPPPAKPEPAPVTGFAGHLARAGNHPPTRLAKGECPTATVDLQGVPKEGFDRRLETRHCRPTTFAWRTSLVSQRLPPMAIPARHPPLPPAWHVVGRRIDCVVYRRHLASPPMTLAPAQDRRLRTLLEVHPE